MEAQFGDGWASYTLTFPENLIRAVLWDSPLLHGEVVRGIQGGDLWGPISISRKIMGKPRGQRTNGAHVVKLGFAGPAENGQ